MNSRFPIGVTTGPGKLPVFVVHKNPKIWPQIRNVSGLKSAYSDRDIHATSKKGKRFLLLFAFFSARPAPLSAQLVKKTHLIISLAAENYLTE